MNGDYSVPAHLPKRLAISFWLWNYFYGIKEGDVFHNLEKRFVELKERGFNAIRCDSGAGLCHTPQGAPRGLIELHEPFPGYSTLRTLSFKSGGCRCDVLKRFLELFELAKSHDVYVILSSWFYLHTFWFVDDSIREEMFAIPVEERFMAFAQEWDRLIGLLKERGLHTQIAFVEIFNEFNGFPYMWGLLKGASPDEEKRRINHEFRRRHEEALEFLRGRHPDVLFAMDTSSPFAAAEVLPKNAQLWNHHMYYSWGIYHELLEQYVLDDRFDFQRARSHPSVGRFLRDPIVSIEEIRKSRNCDPHTHESWYRRVWLYDNLSDEALPSLERLLSETLTRDVARFRKYVDDHTSKALETRNSCFPNLPLVVGEAATYCAHTGMRWEEKSDAYWSLIEYSTSLLKRNGYWGSMPRTNSGPEDPAWTEYPDRLRRVNNLFLSP